MKSPVKIDKTKVLYVSVRSSNMLVQGFVKKGLWIVYFDKINSLVRLFYRYAQKSGVSGIVSAPEAVRAS